MESRSVHFLPHKVFGVIFVVVVVDGGNDNDDNADDMFPLSDNKQIV